MAEHTTIEWTRGPDGAPGATWNVVTGCSVATPGCTNCYAMRLAGTRLQNHKSRAGLTRKTKAGPVWTGEVRFNREWLTQPLKWKRPRRVFVCAHGDLFHEGVSDDVLDQVFAVMAMAPWHTYLVLTKRSDRMRAYIDKKRQNAPEWISIPEVGAKILLPYEGGCPTYIWLGVSVEDQCRADVRIPDLLATPAAVRWISAEPLLGPISLSRIPVPGEDGQHMHALYGYEHVGMVGQCVKWTPPLDWIVVGGESGPGSRPMQPDWARSLRDQCKAAATPFFFKQNGDFVAADTLPSEVQEDFDARGLTDGEFVRVGKKLAGRLLDGAHHDGMPEARHG